MFSSTCMERGGGEIQKVKQGKALHPKQTVFKNNSGDGN